MKEYITADGLHDAPGEPPNPLEVLHCELWITEFCKKQISINPRSFSYSLKHYAENWQHERVNRYCSNGAFIQAAINLGYRYVRDRNTQNAYFNMRISKRAKRRDHEPLP